MGITFKPNTGITVDDASTVLAEVENTWIESFKEDGKPPLVVAPSTPQGQIIASQAEAIMDKDSQLLFLANQFNPKTASGMWQDALAAIYFITRKIDEPTIVTCQCTGLYGTVIPYGAIVRNKGGQMLICNRPATIDEKGHAETTFRCVTTGAIEIAADTVTTIVTTVPGWDTVNNATAGATGRDIETRAEFEARRVKSVAKNSHGSAIAVYGAVADLNGVLDCRVLENNKDVPDTQFGVTLVPHSIAVCAYGGEDRDIAEAIYMKKGGGCATVGTTPVMYTPDDVAGSPVYEYRILRPTPITFHVRVTIQRTQLITESTIASIQEAVYQDFYGENTSTGNARVGLASTVYASRFYPCVMGVAEVQYLNEIVIAFGDTVTNADYSDVVTINADQEPVMSRENVIVIIEGDA